MTKHSNTLTPEGAELLTIICDDRVKRPAPVGPRLSNRPVTTRPVPPDCHARKVAHLRVGTFVVTHRNWYDSHGNLRGKVTRNLIDRIKLSTDDNGNENFLVTFAPKVEQTVTGENVTVVPGATLKYRPDESVFVLNY